MPKKYVFVTVLAAALLETAALAGTCSIKSAGAADEWRFVRVHDVDRGEIVLGQAIRGGDSKPVTVSGERITVAYKLPGARSYKPAVAAACKNGNTVEF